MPYSLKLKTVCVDAPGLPTVTIQNPQGVGLNTANNWSLVTTDEITGIPDNVTAPQVVQIWRETCNMTWLGRDPDDPAIRHSFRFDEIGPGKIIR